MTSNRITKSELGLSAALARLVRAARGSESQEHFAAKLGVSQETLSRYERSRFRPTSGIVARCWEIIERRRDAGPPPAGDLAKRVRRVDGAQHVAVREAIARLIDISVNQARPGRRAR